MQILSEDDAKFWLNVNNIDLAAIDHLMEKPDTGVYFRFPGDAGLKTGLAHAIVDYLKETDILLYVRLTGIWSNCENRFLFQVLRKSVGEEQQVEDSPYHIFAPEDRDYCEAFIAVCSYFSWEYLVATTNSQVVLYFSHDEWIFVDGKNREKVDYICEILDWHHLNRLK